MEDQFTKSLSAAAILVMEGQRGAPGRSAYDLAVAAGYTGTLNQWLESLRGEPGAAYVLTQQDKAEIAAMAAALLPAAESEAF